VWSNAVAVMEKAFRQGRFKHGVLDGIAAIAELLPRRALVHAEREQALKPPHGLVKYSLPDDPLVI
jgi:hypothetical protein